MIEQQLAGGRWLRIDLTEPKCQAQRLADIIAGTDVGTWESDATTGKTRFDERWAAIIG